MIQPEPWKAIHDGLAAAWPYVGPLVGVFIGAYVANRNQRRHWVADNKKREYQELITALTRAFSALLNRSAPLVAHGPEDQRAFAAAEDQALITISDRIFIQDEVERMKVLERWQKMTRDLKQSGDTHALSRGLGDVKGNLIYEPKKLMG